MSRNIRLLYIHNFLTDFRFQTAYLVIFFDQVLGSYTAAMMIMAVEQISSAIMDIPTGIMSDRIGRRKTSALGSLAAAMGVGCYSFADTMTWFVVGAFLSGLSVCLFNGNNNALLYETLKSEGAEGEFHHYQGRTSSMFQLALGIAALCSSFMTSHGLRFIFIAGIIPQLLAVIVSLFFIEPRVHTTTEHKGFGFLKVALVDAWHNPRLRLLIIGQAISYGAGEAAFNFRNVFINQLWPVWALGIYRSINNAGGFLGYWFAGRLIDRFKPPYILIVSEIYWTISGIFAVVISNVISPVIFMMGALFFGPYMVTRDKLLQDEFTDQQRATMGSVASFTGSVFYVVMAFAIGQISDHWGAALGLGFSIAIGALSLPPYIWLFRRRF